MTALVGVRYEDPLVRYRGEKLIDIVRRLSKVKAHLDTDIGVDMFYLFYLPFPIPAPPGKGDPPARQLRHMIAREVLSSEEARRVRYYTIAHSSRSVIVGASFLEHLLRELAQHQNDQGDAGQGRGDQRDRGEGSESDHRQGDLGEAVRKALRSVENELDNFSKLENLSAGTRAGAGSVFEILESAEDIIRLARNTDVQKLLESLSFIEEVTFRPRKKVLMTSRGEIVGYAKGSQVTRISRGEVARLGYHPELFLYKWASGKLTLYEKVVRQDFGPLYLLLDKSGSMDGEKIRWGKATAIALFLRARREGRLFMIRFFDSAPYTPIKVSRSSRPREVMRLIEYLARIKSGGGTDITRSIVVACQDVMSNRIKGLGELILVTDGEDRIAENMVRKNLRESGLRLVTVMVMGENPDLRRISSKYFKVTKLSGKEMLEVLEL